MYEYVNPINNEHQSLHSYLIEKIIEHLGKKLELTETELKDIVNCGYFGMSLLREKIGKEIFKDIYKAIFDVNNNNIKEGIHLKQDVRDFLEECKFPLIVTTCCFPIIENELRNYSSYWCELEQKNEGKLPERCVYHLFGTAKNNNSNWGYNERQLLKFLKNIYTNEYSLKNLTFAINSTTPQKTLFVMGNHAPDWLFRFILTPIYGDDLYNDGTGFYMNDDVCKNDATLSQFLREINFEQESQLMEVLNNVTKRINEKKQKNIQKKGQNVNGKPHGFEYDFFVAHASEDNTVAEKLVKVLRDNRLNVWADFENIKDGKYWDRIIEGLKNSAYFMPLVTENYIRKIIKKEDKEDVFLSNGISEISLDMSVCIKLKELSGVQVELLLAEKWLEQNPKNTYSIPIILKGSELACNVPITCGMVDVWGRGSQLLPENLFGWIQGNEFDVNNPQLFVLDLDRYKYEIED